MKVQHYIVNPYTGHLNTLSEWRNYVTVSDSAKIEDAQCICIIPEEGIPFAFPKNDIGTMGWKKAVKKVADAVVPLPDEFLAKYATRVGVGLPTRAQGAWIGECNYALPNDEQPEVTLDDMLEAIGGKAFGGANFWSSSRFSASLAWYFVGSAGFAYNNNLTGGCRALPVLLCPGAQRP
jgi:hypothetical protein